MQSINRNILVTVLTVAFVALPLVVLAQESNLDDEESFQPQKGHPGFFASGSIYLQAYSPDLAPFNQEIVKTGIPEFDRTIFQYGVHAFGSLQKKWRIGGFFYAGSTTTSGFVYDTVYGGTTLQQYERYAKLFMQGGGLSGAYQIALPKSFEIEPSLWLGYTSVKLELSETSGSTSWDGIWNGYRRFSGTTQSTIRSDYIYVQPGVTVRYYVKQWFAVGVSGQYVLPVTKADKWCLAGYRVKDAKTFDPSGINWTLMASFGI